MLRIKENPRTARFVIVNDEDFLTAFVRCGDELVKKTFVDRDEMWKGAASWSTPRGARCAFRRFLRCSNRHAQV
jgi:hypothetical protein